MISPLPSPENSPLGVTALGSGSKGNSFLIHCGTNGILVDAGFSLRELRRRLRERNIPESYIKAILVTHEHADHIKGLRVCAEHFSAPVYASARCADALKRKDPKLSAIHRFSPGGTFALHDFMVTPFDIKHDAVEPVAFVIHCGQKKIGIATDLGSPTKMAEYQLHGCDCLILESNHDLNMLAASNRPWSLKQRILGPIGHLSNLATQEMLSRIIDSNTQYITLAHISHECNTPEIALNTADATLTRLRRQDIRLNAARQDEPSETIWL